MAALYSAYLHGNDKGTMLYGKYECNDLFPICQVAASPNNHLYVWPSLQTLLPYLATEVYQKTEATCSETKLNCIGHASYSQRPYLKIISITL